MPSGLQKKELNFTGIAKVFLSEHLPSCQNDHFGLDSI